MIRSFSVGTAISRLLGCALLGSALLGCNVTPASTSGGADLPERGSCPRGVAVVQSDYTSSEIALLTPEGDVKSAAFISSASTTSSGLAAPLSGDVVVATAHAGELVVIDRFGTNVLSFVDVATAAVRAQLPVGTGFESNPQGYLELSEHKAYVPRLSENASPGREPFDSGSDLLLIDPSEPKIIGSVPMPQQPGFWPSPAGITRFAGDALVVLEHARPDYSGMADGEIVAVAIADDSVRYRLPLAGLQNCGAVAVSPSGKRLALACSAWVDRKGAVKDLGSSGLVLLDATQDPPLELRRFAAADLADGPIQASVVFFDEGALLFKSQTAQGSDQDNRLFSLELESGKATLLASSARALAGQGFGVAFAGMSCEPGCAETCLVADISRGKLLRFAGGAGSELTPRADVQIHGAGLPPTSVVPFW